MRAANDKLHIARAVATSGADYLTTGTLTYATVWPLNLSTGWYSFVVGEEATVTAVTFKSKAGATLTHTPTWKDVALPVGSFWPAGFIAGEDAYISSITLSGGKIALYLD